jgi:hypothetical protein
MKEEGFKNEFPSFLYGEFFEKLKGKIFYEERMSNLRERAKVRKLLVSSFCFYFYSFLLYFPIRMILLYCGLM